MKEYVEKLNVRDKTGPIRIRNSGCFAIKGFVQTTQNYTFIQYNIVATQLLCIQYLFELELMQ